MIAYVHVSLNTTAHQLYTGVKFVAFMTIDNRARTDPRRESGARGGVPGQTHYKNTKKIKKSKAKQHKTSRLVP